MDIINTFKILLIGDMGVGKTSIISKYVDDRFNSYHLSTIGIDFKTKYLKVNNQKYKLQIWDTAGQERFRTITSSYYRGAHGIIIIFDSSIEDGFKNVSDWLENLDRYLTNRNPIKFLVSNKCDKKSKVNLTEIKKFATDHDLNFYQTSTKTGEGLHRMFSDLTAKMKDNKGYNKDNKDNDNVTLTQNDKRNKFCKFFKCN